MDDNLIYINDRLAIRRDELTFRSSRSGGPGGQHVNMTDSRIELTFNVCTSSSLDEEQRAILLEALKNRIDSEGDLRVVSGSERSQYRNREVVLARFVMLLQNALRPRTPRKATRVPRGAREARLQDKRRRGETKARRRGEE